MGTVYENLLYLEPDKCPTSSFTELGGVSGVEAGDVVLELKVVSRGL